MGLGNDVATNSIFAFPSFKATKCTLMMGDNTLVSGLLGFSFQLKYMVPPRATTATMVANDASISFMSATVETPAYTPLSQEAIAALTALSSAIERQCPEAVTVYTGHVVAPFAAYATLLEKYLALYQNSIPDLGGILCHKAIGAVFMHDSLWTEYNKEDSAKINYAITQMRSTPQNTRGMYSTAQVFKNVANNATGTQKKQEADGIPEEIMVSQRKFVAKAASAYIEPDLGPNLLDGMELIFKNYGKSV
jgi:hypothetical protein